MSKQMHRVALCSVALVGLLAGAGCVLLYPFIPDHLDIDFFLRFHEVCSVLEGVDPFLIWNRTVVSEAYVPWSFSYMPYWNELPMVHAYPPWAYVFMFPFALFDRETAASMYRALQLICLGAVFAFVLFRMKKLSGCWWWMCVCFAGLCVTSSIGFTCCLIAGNFGIVSTAAAFAALWSHEHGHDDLAGLCWYFVLLKPQLGGLFLLTLLLERKWRTLFVTGIVAGAATLVVSYLCGRNPMEMILCIGECSLGQFPGTGLIPEEIYCKGIRYLGERLLLAISACAGILSCIIAWLFLRSHPNVWVRFLPAAILSCVWSTWRLHDFSIHLLVAYVLLSMIWKARGVYLGLLLSLLVAVGLRGWLVWMYDTTWMVCCNYVSLILLWLTVKKISDLHDVLILIGKDKRTNEN